MRLITRSELASRSDGELAVLFDVAAKAGEAMKVMAFKVWSGIPIVVLVRLDERLHVLRRHKTHRVALHFQRPPQMVGAAARFHADQAGRHVDRLRQ